MTRYHSLARAYICRELGRWTLVMSHVVRGTLSSASGGSFSRGVQKEVGEMRLKMGQRQKMITAVYW